MRPRGGLRSRLLTRMSMSAAPSAFAFAFPYSITLLVFFSIGFGLCLATSTSVRAQPVQAYVDAEPNPFRPHRLAERRTRMWDAFPHGLVILKANERLKEMEQPSWIQDPDFLYLTGLAEVPSAILVLDGPARRAVLFAPPAPRSFGLPLEDRDLRADSTVTARTGIPSVLDWSHFGPYVEGRLRDGVDTLFTSAPRRPDDPGTPLDMYPVAGRHAVWANALEQRFPRAVVASARPALLQLRWVKSPDEIAQLRLNAAMSAHALLEGMRAVEPGMRQRVLEGTVVSACLEAGATAPSFWPWMMAGANAHIHRLVTSFLSYSGLDRRVQEGELLRADIGCQAGQYGGDVGRTVPVSGAFSPEQAVIWDLLVDAYTAGLDAMRPGVPLDSVRAASRAHLLAAAAAADELESSGTDDTSGASNRAALARAMAHPTSGVDWHIHGIGIESAETTLPVLAAGTVIAYEPMFIHGPDAYYLEDMILVTPGGAEILTTGLPRTAAEMAHFLGGTPNSAN